MGKTLVLTEKPSVGRDIARVLGCKQNGNGFIIGAKYIITWALGHLVTLAEPEEYGERYKKWSIEDLPMLPKKMELVVIKQTAKQFGVIRNLIKRRDVDKLVIATDAGREGELVARWIINKIGFKKPVKRLWISSQTDRAIKEGFNKLKDSKEYDNLYKSAQCRAEADWLVGLNITRALTCKHNVQLSAGRVQTPTLAMVVKRENEIKRFVLKNYWLVEASIDEFTIQWRDKKGQTRIFDKTRAESILSKIKGKTAKVTEISKELCSEPVPLAYDLTELQRDANRKYGYSAKKTLSIMQKLYESHKLVTYPRTDSKHITEDIVPTLNERLKSIAVGPYARPVHSLLKNGPKITKRFVDNSKVTDHHAIIPTEQYVNLTFLDNNERNIYDLILKRFIAVLGRPFQYEQTTITIEVEGELFKAKGKVVKEDGWKSVYGNNLDNYDNDEDEKEQVLPAVKKGEFLKVVKERAINKKTKPPARYTEATLLSAMEHPGKFINDKVLRKVIDSASGLGTPATRADIIEKLFDSFYLERRGKEIIPTSKGIQLIDIVPEDLKSAELTAKWEQQLFEISKGEMNQNIFIQKMKHYSGKLVSSVIASNKIYRHDNITQKKCPECGKFLLNVNSKRGRMFLCSDRECGYRKGISQMSNARCPKCNKKMEIRGDDKDRTFFCICGHREKLSAFKKRKGERVNKKEVRRFLNQQKGDEKINTALADALSKWKS